MRHNIALAGAALLGWTLIASAGEISVEAQASSQETLPPVASTYFAPADPVFYRLRHENGTYREFQRDLDGSPVMTGAQGWRARIKGKEVQVVSPKGADGSRFTYVFDRGRLVRFAHGGDKVEIPYAAARAPLEGVPAPFLFGTKSERFAVEKPKDTGARVVGSLFKNKWKRSGRLRFPFNNPNENGFLYASLALLSLLGLFLRPKAAKIAAASLSAAFAILLVLTASRGSMLAFMLGLAAVAAPNAKKALRNKWTWIVFGVVALAAAAWFGTQRSSILTRGFKGQSKWSNEVRLSMWKTAPRMMLDAPGGWSAYNIGRAYVDWYEDFDLLTAPGSLINDHLTKLVRYGRCGRAAYVFFWTFLVTGLAFWGWRTKNGVPCGMALAFAAAAWFNPLMINKVLFAAPVAALLPVAWNLARRGREIRWRRVAVACGVSLCAVAAFFAAVHVFAKDLPSRVPIHVDGATVCVNGTESEICILDDGNTLGGIFSCKEIRMVYLSNPGFPPVAYVRRVEDVPPNVARLVIGGEIADEWMRRIATDAKAREELPEELVLISPPFPPSAIPPPLLDACRVKYVTGEFNAAFDAEFASPPGWVEIVPGMELYIEEWLRYAFID